MSNTGNGVRIQLLWGRNEKSPPLEVSYGVYQKPTCHSKRNGKNGKSSKYHFSTRKGGLRPFCKICSSIWMKIPSRNQNQKTCLKPQSRVSCCFLCFFSGDFTPSLQGCIIYCTRGFLEVHVSHLNIISWLKPLSR